ncbi:helix-turn-helix domain-containing protein [Methylobacterium iners]|uniref:helix-turn-helix domain-containing protein n=1 Tax=Methylobacterium iners TaxID=418707 RepID=UPI001EE1806B|nr:helix-turn-helix domain-containing protein [Methylobacterium iners]
MERRQVTSTRIITAPLDGAEAAQFLGLARATLRNWRSRGVGPSYRKHGGKVLYPLAGLEAWSAAQQRPAPPPPVQRPRPSLI